MILAALFRSGRDRRRRMVGIEYIAHSAISAWRERGTEMARAALAALGIRPSDVAAARMPAAGSVVSERRWLDLAECFKNRESPMDGRCA